MKNLATLEEEKRALLARMQSSRAEYHRLLTHSDARPTAPPDRSPTTPEGFPRSMTMRWIIDHPYALVFAAVAVVALGRSRLARTAFDRVAMLAQAAMRVQARAQIAVRMISMVTSFIRQRRM